MSQYPPSMDEVKTRLETLATRSTFSPEWKVFMRDIIRMPMWMQPAVYQAVQDGVWKGPGDPLIRIRGAVRKLAIDMRLRNSESPTMAQLLPDSDPAHEDPRQAESWRDAEDEE